MLREHTRSCHDLGVGRLPALAHPIKIMQLRRAVATQADQKSMLLEKDGPVGVKQRAVGL